jgi:hypothetical protein
MYINMIILPRQARDKRRENTRKRRPFVYMQGLGGDNSDGAVGTFYEGAMTKGFSSNATDAALQASIVAAGFGK